MDTVTNQIKFIINIREINKAYSVDEIRKVNPKAYAPWTEEDDNRLELHYCEGKTTAELSKIFGRNNGAINSRIKKLELKEKYSNQ
jgi:hypothetical protein